MSKTDNTATFNQSKHFKFMKFLGSGGTGDTRLYLDETTDIKFAFKKYAPKGSNDTDETYSRFVDEIKILFNLSHPNIVRVYNYYLYPEMKTGYIQMEYVEGTSIDNYITLFGKSWSNVFIETINAFKYLEDNHVLHRDIRPSNILLDSTDTVKIIDFGFGKNLDVNETGGDSIFLNWPVSEWPQEVSENKTYTHQSEIYFLGKLFKKLPLEEDKPFKFNHILEKMVKVATDERYISFSEITLAISQGIIAAMDFSPSDKKTYQDFADNLIGKIHNYSNEFSYNDNVDQILSGLEELLRVSALESFLQDNSKLISCFVTSSYHYNSYCDIPVQCIRDFYDFLHKLPPNKQKIVLDNLVTRLARIKVEVEVELPF